MLNMAAYEKTDTATREELGMLIAFANYGVSICFSGGTSSGKTTDMAFLLSNIQPDKRIVTIEETPELIGLERTDGKGNIEGRLIQFVTREHPSDELNIDMNDMLRFSLRQNPDVLVPSEMRGAEALAAQEAAHTGHTVITSLHANSARETHGRILTMCRMSGTMLSDELLSRLIAEAFPIIVFKKQMADNSRKIMEIVEMEWQDGKVQYTTLFKYKVSENITDDSGKTVQVKGRHEKCGRVSDKLLQRMLENGAPNQLIQTMGGVPA